MITPVACTPQIDSDPWPCWKMKTMIPNAAPSDTRLSSTALTGSSTDRKARISSTNVSRITNASTYGNFP